MAGPQYIGPDDPDYNPQDSGGDVFSRLAEALDPTCPPQGPSTADVVLHPIADPWRHRSAGMKCSTCMWYAEKTTTNLASTAPAPSSVTIGRCRRHAPTMNGYPVVYPTDWCGDHKLDETKV